MSHLLNSAFYPYECKQCGKRLKSDVVLCNTCANHNERYISVVYEFIKKLDEEEKMTPDKLYEMGYEDGRAGKTASATYISDSNYAMGFEDGRGDADIEKPVSDKFTEFNDAPEGFEFTGEKRVPEPYEFYLSKGGSATFLRRERKNNQTRHILKCAYCQSTKRMVYRNSYVIEGCSHHPEVKGRD